MGKSSDGSGVSDPPFEQLSGSTGGGWRDRISAFGQGAFNAIAPTEFKEAIAGVGDARAFQKRRDERKQGQVLGLAEAEHDNVMTKVRKNKGGFYNRPTIVKGVK